MKKILFLFLFLFAQQAFAFCAVDHVVVHPQPLYSDEAGDVWVTGGCSQGSAPYGLFVDVEGLDINVIIDADGSGPLMPIAWGERFELPILEPGRYTMRFTNRGSQAGTYQFDVLERPFRITPSFAARGTEVMITNLPLDECEGVCPPVRVRFGNVVATQMRSVPNALIVTIPENATSGDVTVELPGSLVDLTFEDGVRFTNDAPDQYDRVMFPVNFAGPGAQGAEWRTDIAVRNDAPIAVDTNPSFWNDPAIPTLPIPGPIAPGGRGQIPQEPRDGGKFLYVPPGLESSFAYASHALDRSRSTTDLGTEVPVVRAKDTGKEIRFVQIPVDARYRAKLRIYDFDGTNMHSVFVSIRRAGVRELLVFREVALIGAPTCAGVDPCFPDRPSFGSIDLEQIPELRNVDVVDITLHPRRNDARLWASVSITNNETQAVTLHTPQHAPAK
jgi:hypothetical protein